MTTRITPREARRLALSAAGLLRPADRGLPSKGRRAPRSAAHAVIRHFGYLQLDTISVAGARSHGIVLHSRLDGYDPTLAETLLRPGEPLFEYWAHEASWSPIELYPTLAFRRRHFPGRRWWKNAMEASPGFADQLLKRIADEGPLRSEDLDGRGEGGWWGHKPAKQVAVALWSSGELAIRSRKNFLREFDLAERVIPDAHRRDEPAEVAIPKLLLLAAQGLGWATAGTLAAAFRLRVTRPAVKQAFAQLIADGRLAPCTLVSDDGQEHEGWIRPQDRSRAAELAARAIRSERAVLLSPFDPLLWDRGRVQNLFDFPLRLEVYTPQPQRVYGYFCLPVLYRDRLIGRVDLKAWRAEGRLEVRASHFESSSPTPRERAALGAAMQRYADAVALELS